MTFMTRFRTIMTISPFFPFDLHCDSNCIPFWAFSDFRFGSCNLLPIAFVHSFIYLDAMSSWPCGRSRSRTTTPPRRRGAARSSRPSTSTHQPPQETTSVPRGVTSYRPPRWPALDRHVLAIINFQDLADLSARLEFTPDNVDFLDAECRTHLGAIEEISLFTWCRHVSPF